MEFYDSQIKSAQSMRLRRLTLAVSPIKTCWAALPAALCNQLYSLAELPVVLQIQVLDSTGRSGQRVVYVAWSGDTSRASNTLELSAAFASCLGLYAGIDVQVTPLPLVAPATSVEVEPLGSDDWEVLEANAGYLEDQMLNQVGVLAHGQPFAVWVNQQALVRLRPTSSSPAALVRLVPGSEVVVAPKARALGSRPEERGGGNRPADGRLPGPAEAAWAAPRGAEAAGLALIEARQAGTAAAVPVQPKGTAHSASGATAATAAEPVQATTLRACVMPPTERYLLRLRVPDTSPGFLTAQAGAPTAGTATPTAHPETLYSWLTSAVVVHPDTARRRELRPGLPIWVHGSGAVPRMALLLLADAACPRGHLMLAPCVLQALGLLADHRVKLTTISAAALLGSTSKAGPEVAAAAAAATALPLLALHPVAWREPAAAAAAARGTGQEGLGRGGSGLPAAWASGQQAPLQPEARPQQGSGGGGAGEGSNSQAGTAMSSSSAAAPESLTLLLALLPEAGAPNRRSGGAADESGRPGQAVSLQKPPLQQGLGQAVAAWAYEQALSLQAGSESPHPIAGTAVQGAAASPVSAAAPPCEVLSMAPTPPEQDRLQLGLPLAPGLLLHLSVAAGAGADQYLGAPPWPAAGSATVVECLLMLLLEAPQPRASGSVTILTAERLQPMLPGTVPPMAVLPAALRGVVTLPQPRARCWRHANNLLMADAPDAGDEVAGQAGQEELAWLRDQLKASLRRVTALLDSAAMAASLLLELKGDNVSGGGGRELALRQQPKSGGLLVTGPSGSGKTAIAQLLSSQLSCHPSRRVHVLHVRCAQLAGSSAGGGAAGSGVDPQEVLSDVLLEAAACEPSLVVLDDLHLLSPAQPRGGHEASIMAPGDGEAAAKLAQWLADALDQLAGLPGLAVAVMATAREGAALPAVLRQAGRLDYEVRLPAPGAAGRAAMLVDSFRRRGIVFEAPEQLAAIASKAEGYDALDLKVLLDRAVHAAVTRQLTAPRLQVPAWDAAPMSVMSRSGTSATAVCANRWAGGMRALRVNGADLHSALEGFVPPAFWGVQSAEDRRSPVAGWEDVGGLDEVRQTLEESLLLPLRHPELAASAPLRLRTGVLLFGPPGCGKTHVVGAAVAAAAAVASVRFISVKGPELLNKYIGASESAVRELFARASGAAPCVLFFDEFDSIAPRRGHDSTGVTDRVVNQLLTELDGVEGLRGVCVLAATSRPDLLDAALLRPGRLDRLAFCGPPGSAGERLAILRALSRRLPLALDADLAQVAGATGGFTGADLGAILSEAQLLAVHDCLNAQQRQQAASEVTAALPNALPLCTTAATRPGAPGGRSASGSSNSHASTSDKYGSGKGGTAGGDDGAGGACNEKRMSTGNNCTSGSAGGGSDGGGGGGSGGDSDSSVGASDVGAGVNESSCIGISAAGGSSSGSRNSKVMSETVAAPVTATSPDVASAALPVAVLVTNEHLRRAVATARPSLPAAEAARLQVLYDRFLNSREPAATVAAAAVSAAKGKKKATLA